MMPGWTWRRARAALDRLACALLALLMPVAAHAACLPIAQGPGPSFQRAAATTPGRPAANTVALTFLGHASFLLETSEGISAVTDYSGMIPLPLVPDIVTMNNAHPSHYTDSPDPRIAHVLRGWDPEGGMAQHNLLVGDLRVRNVPTNVREGSHTRFNGNSIFVFETANLCLAHLGHLHHTLADVHLGELGEIDVLLAPVDGAFTMDQFDMIEVIHQIAAPLVIPMHYFSEANLARFLERMRATHDVKVSDTPRVVLSRATLPRGRPAVLVLPGY